MQWEKMTTKMETDQICEVLLAQNDNVPMIVCYLANTAYPGAREPLQCTFSIKTFLGLSKEHKQHSALWIAQLQNINAMSTEVHHMQGNVHSESQPPQLILYCLGIGPVMLTYILKAHLHCHIDVHPLSTPDCHIDVDPQSALALSYWGTSQ